MARPVFNIYVEDTSVVGLINAVEKAVSPLSIANFLETEGMDHLIERLWNRFEMEGDQASGKWRPLSDATIEIRSRLGYTPIQTNIRTREMVEFLENNYDLQMIMDGALLVWPGSPISEAVEKKLMTAQMGNALNVWPQMGTTPKRPVVAIDESDLFAFMHLLAVHIAGQIQFGLTV